MTTQVLAIRHALVAPVHEQVERMQPLAQALDLDGKLEDDVREGLGAVQLACGSSFSGKRI